MTTTKGKCPDCGIDRDDDKVAHLCTCGLGAAEPEDVRAYVRDAERRRDAEQLRRVAQLEELARAKAVAYRSGALDVIGAIVSGLATLGAIYLVIQGAGIIYELVSAPPELPKLS